MSYLSENAAELDMILRRERFKTSFHAKTGSIEDHIHKLAVQHGVPEKLGILPLEAQTAYNAVKEAHQMCIRERTTLQREANRYYGFTAQQTLDLVQSLYEKKLLTYCLLYTSITNCPGILEAMIPMGILF